MTRLQASEVVTSMNPALQPAEQYRDIAQGVLKNAPDVRDFLQRCIDCGLPAEQKIEEHEAACEFCTKFLHKFFPDATY